MKSAAPDTDALQRRTRELEILNAVAQSLNASVDLRESLSAALSNVAELLDLRTGWVWLLDETTGEPQLAAVQELPAGLRDHPEAMEGSCYCLDTFRQGDLNGAANVNIVTCSRLRWIREDVEGLRYHASIPLYAGDRKLGVLNVAGAEWRRLTPDELRLLHTVGDMLGVAVERARLYARSIEAGAAEERNRLAREIHDTLAQGLTGVALQLETAEAFLQQGSETKRAGEAIERALAATRLSLEEARRSVLDLRAAPLEGRTLTEALEALVDAAPHRAAPAVELSVPETAPPMPPRVTAGVYRIVQEAITNAIDHAEASRISVHLDVAPDRVQVTVEDDGRGFDPAAVRPGRFGLVGMNERARLLGGTLQLESAPGAGTRIRATIPSTMTS